MRDCARYEPTIDEILADPMVHALMRADRVSPDRLRSKLLQHVSSADRRIAVSARQARPLASSVSGSAAVATAKPLQRQVWG